MTVELFTRHLMYLACISVPATFEARLKTAYKSCANSLLSVTFSAIARKPQPYFKNH